MLGHGIFNVDGELWKIQRKTAANIFSVKHFKQYVAVVFKEEMEVFKKVLISHAGQEIDLSALFFRFTMDSFVRIAFGVLSVNINGRLS
jgi:cytochrome P450